MSSRSEAFSNVTAGIRNIFSIVAIVVVFFAATQVPAINEYLAANGVKLPTLNHPSMGLSAHGRLCAPGALTVQVQLSGFEASRNVNLEFLWNGGVLKSYSARLTPDAQGTTAAVTEVFTLSGSDCSAEASTSTLKATAEQLQSDGQDLQVSHDVPID